MGRRMTKAQAAAAARKAARPTGDEHNADLREAAKAVDGKAMKARGETPPWEEEEGEPCTCTLACIPQGITEGQRCRLQETS